MKVLFQTLSVIGSVLFSNVTPINAAFVNESEILRNRYDALRGSLNQNQFQQPIYLESSEASGGVRGDIYARVDYSFPLLRAAFSDPANWCNIMILHPNIKYCRPSNDNAEKILTVYIGSKRAQPLADAHRMLLSYKITSTSSGYIGVQLYAERGPLKTSNYSIGLEVVAIEKDVTFVHLSYSYSYGMSGLLAMQAYLLTSGQGKEGFTIANKQANGQPNYVRGMRGVVERNTMRYFLASEAFLNAALSPPEQQCEKRLTNWIGLVKQYPRQFDDIEAKTYLDLKRSEILRQNTTR